MTASQLAVLRFIRGHQLAKGWTPNFRAIAVGLGMSANSKSAVFGHLNALEEEGHIRRPARKHQAIEVLTPVPVPRSPSGEPLYFVRIA